MFKIFRKRSLWLPTWPTALAALFICGLTTWLVLANIHPFLSVTERTEGARILVIEGWVADAIIEAEVENFVVGQPYDYICTTGLKLSQGHHLSELKSHGELAAKTLQALGVPEEIIIVAPAPDSMRDRTFHSALGFKQERESSDISALQSADAIDILTAGVHGRRTRTVYRKIFGDDVDIGIIAGEPVDYDADAWFKSSAGVKAVITESISLAYEWFGQKDR